jgi:gamma-glutamylcyclotransferase (GGCT)/AIG2-like uncharacterized protein YtfP
MENSITKLFVYGSLRSGFHHPAYDYISKYFKLVSRAKVKGKLYDMGNYPSALPTNEEAYIVGELYELHDPNNFKWAIEQLDDYEGLNPEEGEQPQYRRATTTVYFNNETTEAWIYWFNGDVQGQPIIASGDIMEFIEHKRKL